MKGIQELRDSAGRLIRVDIDTTTPALSVAQAFMEAAKTITPRARIERLRTAPELLEHYRRKAASFIEQNRNQLEAILETHGLDSEAQLLDKTAHTRANHLLEHLGNDERADMALMWAIDEEEALLNRLRAQPHLVKAAKFAPKGRGRGTIYKAIARLLKKDASMKNAAIWEAIKNKPPKGWEVCDNRAGRYIEKTEGGRIENMGYRRFLNLCAEARNELASG